MAEITPINIGVHVCGTGVRPRYLDPHTECSGRFSHTCLMILMCLLALQVFVPSVLVLGTVDLSLHAGTQTYPCNRVVGRRGGNDLDGCGVSTSVKGDEESRGASAAARAILVAFMLLSHRIDPLQSGCTICGPHCAVTASTFVYDIEAIISYYFLVTITLIRSCTAPDTFHATSNCHPMIVRY
jgi:hypothetical protein